MFARFVYGALMAGATVLPAVAGSMSADEARKFVANKVFAFTCFDGTRGAGRVFEDGGAAGAVQFSGSGDNRFMRLPGNTLQVRGQSICASIKGIPFDPCFNLDKTGERSFRGSVSGMGFAYCDFRHQGTGQMMMARALARPRSLQAPARSADASAARHTEVTASVPTPRVEATRLDPPKLDASKIEAASELRRSTD